MACKQVKCSWTARQWLQCPLYELLDTTGGPRILKLHSVDFKHSSSGMFPKKQRWSPCYKTGKPGTRRTSGFAESHGTPLVEPTLHVGLHQGTVTFLTIKLMRWLHGQCHNSWGKPTFSQSEEGAGNGQLMSSCSAALCMYRKEAAVWCFH